MDNHLTEWSNHPIAIITGMLVMYTASNSIFALIVYNCLNGSLALN